MEKIRILKIRRYGKEGFALSLPREWIRDNHLNLGDEVDIYRENEGLIIKPKGELHAFIEEREKKETAGS